jgi:hypothetical protein
MYVAHVSKNPDVQWLLHEFDQKQILVLQHISLFRHVHAVSF